MRAPALVKLIMGMADKAFDKRRLIWCKVPRVTQSPTVRPWSILTLVSGALLLIGALCLGLGLDRAEKVLSIVGSLAGVVGAAIGMVALLGARSGAYDDRTRAVGAENVGAVRGSGPGAVPPGGIYSGRDTHVGSKINTGGVLAVSGILATLYIVLGATGVARSSAQVSVAEPVVDIASITGRWRNDGGVVGNVGPLQLSEDDTELTVSRAGRFSFSYGIDTGMVNQQTKCTGDVNVNGSHYEFLSASGQCRTFTGRVNKNGAYLVLDMGQDYSMTLSRVR